MKVVFRTDASLQIGTGHVMRCLTLADALTEKGAECHFICREHVGHLLGLIQSKGHQAHSLKVEDTGPSGSSSLTHGHWLGASQQQDAEACAGLLQDMQPDWLVVDHYALDRTWETALRPLCRRLMVIDDLADRRHDADLLLDQTFGRSREDYHALVPPHCTLLCGAHYALLRPEFAAWREYSLQRRAEPRLRHLLITMGGVDKDNATGQVLAALRTCKLPAECCITVVMGTAAPWLENVRQLANGMPWPTTVRVGISNMAELMANSDLALGAAGATTWERCCLSLPSFILVLADNQQHVAHNLNGSGAVRLIPDIPSINEAVVLQLNALSQNPFELLSMSEAAAKITDGLGLKKIMTVMEI